MSKTHCIRSLIIIPVLAFAALMLVVVDAAVPAQNANSGAMQDDMMHQEEANVSRRPARTRRGTTRRTRAQQDANVSWEANANLAGGIDADLSGTYTGHMSLTGGHEMSGPATLTITGNQFTLEMEGMTHSGRILGVTTRGYTGVTLYFSDVTDTVTNTPLAVSARARHRGNSLTLEPVPGARNVMRFGHTSSTRRRARR